MAASGRWERNSYGSGVTMTTPSALVNLLRQRLYAGWKSLVPRWDIAPAEYPLIEGSGDTAIPAGAT